MVAVLLALRFALELALLAALAVVGVRVGGGAIAGWLLAVALVVLAATLWGVLLSPRRRINVPLPARVLIELVLFAVAAASLIGIGFPVWGWVLIAAEVVVLGLLCSRGMPPGSDVGDRSAVSADRG